MYVCSGRIPGLHLKVLWWLSAILPRQPRCLTSEENLFQTERWSASIVVLFPILIERYLVLSIIAFIPMSICLRASLLSFILLLPFYQLCALPTPNLFWPRLLLYSPIFLILAVGYFQLLILEEVFPIRLLEFSTSHHFNLFFHPKILPLLGLYLGHLDQIFLLQDPFW